MLAKSLLRIIDEDDRYDTTERTGCTWSDRLFGRFSWYFYFRMVFVIVDVSRRARRGLFDNDDWQRTGLRLTTLCEQCGGTLHFEGLQHARAVKCPCVVVANHMSMQETFTVPTFYLSRGGAVTVIKRALLRYPVFGPVMEAIRPIALDRVNPREDFTVVMREGLQALNEGRTVVIFPQATRTPYFDRQGFNSMGAKLAAKANVPLQPVAVKTDHIGLGQWVRDFGPLHLERPICFAVGQALDPALGARAMHERSVAFISERLMTWGARMVGQEKGEGVEHE